MKITEQKLRRLIREAFQDLSFVNKSIFALSMQGAPTYQQRKLVNFLDENDVTNDEFNKVYASEAVLEAGLLWRDSDYLDEKFSDLLAVLSVAIGR
jgi:hypothetical protein